MRCDAEVGSEKRGWHSCNRKVTIVVTRTGRSGCVYELHYCKQHEKRALEKPDFCIHQDVRPV